MRTTDFAHCLATYLTVYLPGQLGLSENTIMSYRDTFKLVLLFAEQHFHLRPEKITLSDFNMDFITAFLFWLEQERGCCIATRNQRLAALRAFAQYARSQYPAYLLESQKIMDTRRKKSPVPTIAYLSPDDVASIIEQPDTTTKYGRRDMVLLSLMYDSGARVQEICDLRVRDVRLHKPSTVALTGKGDKTRYVPLMGSTVDALTEFFLENRLSSPEKMDHPLFCNHQRGKLTRAGVAYILKKYFNAAKALNPALPTKISPHVLRHSKAMHMLKAGANLVFIRDFLGHTHVKTTEIYARADTDTKRKAIECAQIKVETDLPQWTEDKSLMAMLTNLCGKD